jgi:hypothetical protein
MRQYKLFHLEVPLEFPILGKISGHAKGTLKYQVRTSVFHPLAHC